MELIKTIVDKFKIKELFGIVFFTTLLITILPESIIKLMYLEEFKEKYATDEEIKLFENAQESGDKSIYDVNQETLKKLGYDLTGLEDFQTDELEK